MDAEALFAISLQRKHRVADHDSVDAAEWPAVLDLGFHRNTRL